MAAGGKKRKQGDDGTAEYRRARSTEDDTDEHEIRNTKTKGDDQMDLRGVCG